MHGRWREWLFSSASGAWLGVVRIGFGLVMLYESLWFMGLTSNSPFTFESVRSPLDLEPLKWSFSYPLFEWVSPLPASLTTALFVVMAVASACVTLGLFYRAAIVTLFGCFAYVNLSDSSFYLNHFYLACVIAFLLICMPANRRYALSNLLSRTHSPRDLTVPRWTLFLLRTQMFIVYFFAGVEKLNSDWLVGEPLRRWLPHPSTAQNLSGVLSDAWMSSLRSGLATESAVLFLSYAGLLFDLSIGFLLVYRRTRPFAFVATVLFHATNFSLFDIGVFPFLAILLTTVFFEPDWPDRLLMRMRRIFSMTDEVCVSSESVPSSSAATVGGRHRGAIVTVLAIWMMLQIGVPIRHYFVPGNVGWTEEGHRFSWRMKLRNKDAGPFRMELCDPARATQHDPLVDDSSAWTYRQVDASDVPWSKLPALIMIYEPMLGERIVLNPLAGRSWLESAARAREMWYAAHGTSIELKRTWPLSAAFDHLRRELELAVHAGDDTPLVTLEILDQLRQQQIALDSTLTGSKRLELQSAFQDTLYRLPREPAWRNKVLSALMQTHPFACQLSSESEEMPFMMVGNASVMRPGKGACCRIDRNNWPGEKQVLIDFRQLGARAMRPLPEVVKFSDFDGRATMFWNEAVELNNRQIAALRRSSLLQHQYAHHVADRCQRMFASRPQVFVTSYVKLNQHPMQLMVEPSVDLAAEPHHWLSHNAWILPLVRADEPSSELAVALR